MKDILLTFEKQNQQKITAIKQNEKKRNTQRPISIKIYYPVRGGNGSSSSFQRSHSSIDFYSISLGSTPLSFLFSFHFDFRFF